MRTDHIRALTGLRFFAAVWVVLFHSTNHGREVFYWHFPNSFDPVLAVTRYGLLGVDLFFVLSGFVLALNYLDQLGPRLRVGAIGRFLWLRLARIWPLYVTVLLIAGAVIVVRHHFWGTIGLRKIVPGFFLQQLLLVQQWFTPEWDSWSGPAWSLSAEWLAYLLFPFLALVVLRLRDRLHAPVLLLAAAVALTPVFLHVLSHHSLGTDAWSTRIVSEFTAGMLLCAGLSRLELTDTERRLAGWGAVASIVGLLVWFQLVWQTDQRWLANLAVVLFLPLIGCLAVGSGWLTAGLSTRLVVLGGGISYALYLVHMPVLDLFRDLLIRGYGVDRWSAQLAETAFLPVIVLLSWLLFRYVEEPARRTMRRMLDHRFPRVEEPLVPAAGEHHQDDRASLAKRSSRR